jgi:hypothetical protein
MDGTILLDGAILHCYLVGYLTYLYVQPVLNRLTRAALEGACCHRRRGPELEEEPPFAPPSVQTLGELDVEMVDLTPTLPPWPEVGKTPHHPQVIIGGAPPPLVLSPRGYP